VSEWIEYVPGSEIDVRAARVLHFIAPGAEVMPLVQSRPGTEYYAIAREGVDLFLPMADADIETYSTPPGVKQIHSVDVACFVAVKLHFVQSGEWLRYRLDD